MIACELAQALDPALLSVRLGITPDPWQRDFLRANERQILLNIHRQAGKSTMGAWKAVHVALYRPGSLVLLLSPSLRQSNELFAKCLSFFKMLGRPIGTEAENTLTLKLANGSRIVSLPGKEGTVRGFSAVDLLLLDEASRIDDSLLAAVRPMLAVSGGQLILMSTPYGQRGAFFEAWENGGTDWRRFKVVVGECPRIAPEFLEQERRTLGNLMYAQEYEGQFLHAAGQLFLESDIVAAFSDNRVRPLFPDMLLPVHTQERAPEGADAKQAHGGAIRFSYDY